MPISTDLTIENLSLILDAIPVPVFIKDENSRFVGMNRACEEHWGITFEKIKKTNGSAFFPAQQMSSFLEKDREIFSVGTVVDFEEQVWNHKLQHNRVSHTFKQPIYSAEGNPRFLVCAMIDVTVEKEAGASLRHTNEKLRSLYELAPLGIALTSMSGKFVEFNEEFCRICGYSREELAALDYWKITPPEYMAEEANQLAAMAATGRYGPFEKDYIHKSGVRIPLRLSGVVVTGADNQPYIWSIVEDMSKTRATEERLRQAEKLEAVGKLTAGIAHDFNNLLGIIISDIETTLVDPDLPETARRRLARALGAADRGAALTQQLLSFSRRQALSPRTVDLRTEVEETVKLVKRTLPANIRVELVFATQPVTVRVDTNQLSNALINLCINARDAMKNGGSLLITIGTENWSEAQSINSDIVPAGTYGVVSIQDSGTGMSTDTLSKAFEPFFTTKESGQGSGLGLSMVYGFMRQSNGFAHLTSRENEGTTVRLLLPINEQTDPLQKHGATATPSPTAAQRKVLVVEDIADFRFALTEQLESLGFKVVAVDNGASGLAQLEAMGDFDLIMSDLGLPGGMSGFEFAAAATATHPTLKVMTMSGYNSMPENATAPPPEWRHLHKPFTRAALAEAIKALVPAE